MKLSPNVKIKRGLWKVFPFSKYTAQAIYPNIYFSEKVYENLISNKPKPRYIASLLHEQTHINRQKEMGWIKWGLKYIISPQFRFREELEAIKASTKYLKKEEDFDTARIAKYLSGWLYLWCVSYEKAKEELDRVWKEA